MDLPSDGTHARAVGATALRITSITYGAMGFGSAGDEDDGHRRAVIEAAIGSGIAAIDTAPLYSFGRSERLIGRVLAATRERPRVLTKVGLRWDDDHGEPLFTARDADGSPLVVRRDSRPESVLLEIERSLERLRLDAIDLVQVHQRDRRVPIGETMAALRDAVRSGSVRHVGVSNFDAAEVGEAIAALGDVPLASLQSPYSLLVRDVERDGLRATRAAGAGFLAYSPLAQGLLTGAYGLERALRADDWRATLPLFSTRSRSAIARAIDDVARPIAHRHGATVSQIALAWVIAQPGVTSAIAGASSVEQVRENAAAMQVRLEPGELAALARAFRELPVDRAGGIVATARGALRGALRRLRGA